jgi:hypothetical protein
VVVRFAVATLGAALLLPGASFAQSPSPAPSAPSPAASAKPARAAAAKDAALRVHRALVNCDLAPFYDWPAPDVAPSGSSYPPARLGDVFDVIGDAHVSPNGLDLYETTIDVVHPWGNGAHYWISSRCVTTV